MYAYGSIKSKNSNDSMQKLTIITVLLAVPTMIAGFWGMNMPVPGENGVSFLQTGWFWLVLIATIALTAIIAVALIRGNPFKNKTHKKRKKKDKKEKKDN